MLGDEVLAVDDLPMHLVAQFVLQRVEDDFERAPMVVGRQVLHVFQQERRRTFRGDDARHVEEQGALGLVPEAGLAAEAALLRHAR